MIVGCNEAPPLTDCSYKENGTLTFVEMHLLIPDNNKPAMFDSDHSTTYTGYCESFTNILDNNLSSTSDDASVSLIVSCSDCNGDYTKMYEKTPPPSNYSYNQLYDTPIEPDYGIDKVVLTVTSADYGNYYCKWDATFMRSDFSTQTSIQAGDIVGTWHPKSKAQEDGKPKVVYVHDTFNNYIYTY